jgi:hypothetical protein
MDNVQELAYIFDIVQIVREPIDFLSVDGRVVIFQSFKDTFRPVTVAARSKGFARFNTGIVGSNPARGMDVCLRLCLCCPV